MDSPLIRPDRGSRNDRKWKNILIKPSRQLKFAFIATVGLLTFLFSFFAFQLWVMSSVIRSVSTYIPLDSPLNDAAAQAMSSAWLAFTAFTLLFSFITLTATLIITHRIYGPIHAMRKQVELLIAGDLTARVQLRQDDEFKELASDLNKLGEKLSNENPSKF